MHDHQQRERFVYPGWEQYQQQLLRAEIAARSTLMRPSERTDATLTPLTLEESKRQCQPRAGLMAQMQYAHATARIDHPQTQHGFAVSTSAPGFTPQTEKAKPKKARVVSQTTQQQQQIQFQQHHQQHHQQLQQQQKARGVSQTTQPPPVLVSTTNAATAPMPLASVVMSVSPSLTTPHGTVASVNSGGNDSSSSSSGGGSAGYRPVAGEDFGSIARGTVGPSNFQLFEMIKNQSAVHYHLQQQMCRLQRQLQHQLQHQQHQQSQPQQPQSDQRGAEVQQVEQQQQQQRQQTPQVAAQAPAQLATSSNAMEAHVLAHFASPQVQEQVRMRVQDVVEEQVRARAQVRLLAHAQQNVMHEYLAPLQRAHI